MPSFEVFKRSAMNAAVRWEGQDNICGLFGDGIIDFLTNQRDLRLFRLCSVAPGKLEHTVFCLSNSRSYCANYAFQERRHKHRSYLLGTGVFAHNGLQQKEKSPILAKHMCFPRKPCLQVNM